MSYASGTHYSGVGNEIRQTGASPDIAPKIYTSLPQGLGRYTPGSNDMLFNITNYLGSTVLGVPSNYTLGYDVFDFSAYGMQAQELVTHSGDDKISEAFTGKEFDEKIGLQYFGARYYDPQLALWISPDPMRQFASPYAYSPDPINSVDPDGMYSGDAPGVLGGSCDDNQFAGNQNWDPGYIEPFKPTLYDARISVGMTTANGDVKGTVGTDIVAVSGKSAKGGVFMKTGVMGRAQWGFRNTTPGLAIRTAVEVDVLTLPAGTITLFGVPFKLTAAGGWRQNLSTMGVRPSGTTKATAGPFFFSVDVRGPSLTPGVDSE
jgi:RHS repeat-associated protein